MVGCDGEASEPNRLVHASDIGATWMAKTGSARCDAAYSEAIEPGGGPCMNDQNYDDIAPTKVLSAAEGIEIQKRLAAESSG